MKKINTKVAVIVVTSVVVVGVLIAIFALLFWKGDSEVLVSEDGTGKTSSVIYEDNRETESATGKLEKVEPSDEDASNNGQGDGANGQNVNPSESNDEASDGNGGGKTVVPVQPGQSDGNVGNSNSNSGNSGDNSQGSDSSKGQGNGATVKPSIPASGDQGYHQSVGNGDGLIYDKDGNIVGGVEFGDGPDKGSLE